MKKTKIIKKTLNPEWNEAIDLYGNLTDFLATDLVLKVIDIPKRRRPAGRPESSDRLPS